MPLHALIISENGETDAIIESMVAHKPNLSADDILDAIACQPVE
jgi:hypothetical protein